MVLIAEMSFAEWLLDAHNSLYLSDLYLNGVLLVCQNWIYKINFEKVAIIFNRAITSSKQHSCMLLWELIFIYVLKNKIYKVEVYGLQQKFVFVFRVYGKEDLSKFEKFTQR